MREKLTGKALAKFEAKRDIWQEVLDGVREIKGWWRKKRTSFTYDSSRNCTLPLIAHHPKVVLELSTIDGLCTLAD